jgi:hypothetical protein
MSRVRRPIALAAAVGACAVAAACAGGGTVSGRGTTALVSSPPVAVVGTVAIPRADFLAAYRVAAPSGPAVHAGTATPLENRVLQGLVQKTIVWVEARRLGLAAGTPLRRMLLDETASQLVYQRLYDRAASGVPAPHDRRIAQYAVMDQDTPNFLTPRQTAIYNAWQGRRDRVASAFFGRILHRYARVTRYARGFHPAPPYA